MYEGSLSTIEKFNESQVKDIASSAVDDVRTGVEWVGYSVAYGVGRAGVEISNTYEENKPRLSNVAR